MGLFYTNFTLRGPAQAKVLEELRSMGRKAFVSPIYNGYITVYDRQAEEQNFGVIEELGSGLSQRLHCPVFAAALHDDDVLYYWLFRDGVLCHDYNSSPAYFDADSEPLPPAGGDAGELCTTFGCLSREAELESALTQDLLSETATIASELERHDTLARILGFPAYSVGVGYGTIHEGFLPEEFRSLSFVRV